MTKRLREVKRVALNQNQVVTASAGTNYTASGITPLGRLFDAGREAG